MSKLIALTKEQIERILKGENLYFDGILIGLDPREDEDEVCNG